MADLRVRVTTKASRGRVEADGHGGCRVWVSAPPAEGEANKAVVELIAKQLAVGPSGVVIAKGARSRDKVLAIEGVSVARLAAWLHELPKGGAK